MEKFITFPCVILSVYFYCSTGNAYPKAFVSNSISGPEFSSIKKDWKTGWPSYRIMTYHRNQKTTNLQDSKQDRIRGIVFQNGGNISVENAESYLPETAREDRSVVNKSPNDDDDIEWDDKGEDVNDSGSKDEEVGTTKFESEEGGDSLEFEDVKVDISHQSAKALCRALDSELSPGIAETRSYLWAPIYQYAPALGRGFPLIPPMFTPECLKWQLKPCNGTARFPMMSPCTYWAPMPIRTEKCFQYPKTLEVYKRGRLPKYNKDNCPCLWPCTPFFDPIQQCRTNKQIDLETWFDKFDVFGNSNVSFQIPHYKATQLCHGIRSFINQETPVQIKSIPIRIQTLSKSPPDNQNKCLAWRYTSCNHAKSTSISIPLKDSFEENDEIESDEEESNSSDAVQENQESSEEKISNQDGSSEELIISASSESSESHENINNNQVSSEERISNQDTEETEYNPTGNDSSSSEEVIFYGVDFSENKNKIKITAKTKLKAKTNTTTKTKNDKTRGKREVSKAFIPLGSFDNDDWTSKETNDYSVLENETEPEEPLNDTYADTPPATSDKDGESSEEMKGDKDVFTEDIDMGGGLHPENFPLHLPLTLMPNIPEETCRVWVKVQDDECNPDTPVQVPSALDGAASSTRNPDLLQMIPSCPGGWPCYLSQGKRTKRDVRSKGSEIYRQSNYNIKRKSPNHGSKSKLNYHTKTDKEFSAKLNHNRKARSISKGGQGFMTLSAMTKIEKGSKCKCDWPCLPFFDSMNKCYNENGDLLVDQNGKPAILPRQLNPEQKQLVQCLSYLEDDNIECNIKNQT